MLKQIFKQLIPNFYLDYIHRLRIDQQIVDNYNGWRNLVWDRWVKEGEQLPPPHAVKQKVIADYQKKYNTKILVETGTLHGDMIEAQKRNFESVYSIELDQKLYNEAIERFKYDRKVHLILGDSGKKIFDIINSISTRAVFWLDGHYSGTYTALGDVECPIYGEIDGVFSGKIKDHILLVDDARCFVGENSYPTVEELYNYIKKYNPNYKMSVFVDILRFEV